ncbi:MAG TPA: menaquinone biosynthesis protein [Candidatus Polarisedimenticolia bacterium]|nr:menaquinone biosynthesis protein [Candidatus Polarisedimenticolia bacterium]
MTDLKLATVPFVNAEPLLWGFRRGPYHDLFEVTSIAPSQIPGLLRAGQADVGLIPSIEYQRLPGVEILPDLCIASRQQARSVLLVSRLPLDGVRRVALDSNSRTSAALLRILLAHRGRPEIEYAERAPSLREMLRDNDAALLIGDGALTADTGGLLVIDLAAEWFAITGLPFVFALWAVRAGTTLPDGVGPFLESRRLGIAEIPTIARQAATRLGIAAESIESYLRSNIHFHLGTEEARGLDLFFRQSRELGLIDTIRPIQIHQPTRREPAPAGQGDR